MVDPEIMLSVILFGSNDDYQDHWLKRLEYCLNFNLSELKKSNCTQFIEFHIVDHFSEEKISENIKVYANSSKVYFHFIDHNVTNDEALNPAFCMNTGVRGANGKFVLFMGVDQLLTFCHWQKLIGFMRDGLLNKPAESFYLLIPRIQLHRGFPWYQIDLDDLSNLLLRAPTTSQGFRNLKKNVGGGAGALLVSKDFFIKNGMFGTEGNSGYGGEDIELNAKAKMSLCSIDSLSLGIFCYKLPYSGGFRSQVVKKFQNRKRNEIKTKYFYKYVENKTNANVYCQNYHVDILIKNKKNKISFIQHLTSLKKIAFLISCQNIDLRITIAQYIAFNSIIEDDGLFNFVIDRKSMFAFAGSIINGKNYYPVTLITTVQYDCDLELQSVVRLIDQNSKNVEINIINNSEDFPEKYNGKLNEWSFKKGQYVITSTVKDKMNLGGYVSSRSILEKLTGISHNELTDTDNRLKVVGSNEKMVKLTGLYWLMVMYTWVFVRINRLRIWLKSQI